MCLQDDKEIAEIIRQVRSVRAGVNTCLSAQPGVSVTQILREIVENEVYRHDYEKLTLPLLYKRVEYEEAIGTMRELIRKKLFD